MIGSILTQEQADSIRGVFFNAETFFWPVKDVNGVEFLFLSDQDKEWIYGSEWEWTLTLPTGNYIPPEPPV
jgi:hypothetical protein